MASPGPLSNIRVLDLTMWVQGPMAGTLLADLGADVIKIEKAGIGDYARSMQTVYGVDMRKDGSPNLLWTACNRNKRGLALDLGHPAARPAFEVLVSSADVFLTNLMPGALADSRADEASLRALNPGIIFARAAGFGQVGPWANDPCQDTVGMAYAGLLFTCSPDGETPYYPPGAMSDVLSGTMMAFGILAALRERERTREGQSVSTSQLQTLMWMQSLNIGAAANLGQSFEHSDRLAPPNPMFNTYRCGDGRWLALGMAVPSMWPDLCRAIGLESLIEDARFATAGARREHAADAVRILDGHLLTRPAEYWLERLRARGLWVGPINRVADLIDDEMVRANGYLMEVEDGTRTSRMPFTLGGHAPANRAAPAHGEHTAEILAEAGLGEDELVELRASGAIW